MWDSYREYRLCGLSSVTSLLPTVYLQRPSSHDSLPRHIRRTKNVRQLQDDRSGLGDPVGYLFKEVYLGHGTNNRDPEKKPKKLNHDRDNFNYAQTVLCPHLPMDMGRSTGTMFVNGSLTVNTAKNFTKNSTCNYPVQEKVGRETDPSCL